MRERSSREERRCGQAPRVRPLTAVTSACLLLLLWPLALSRGQTPRKPALAVLKLETIGSVSPGVAAALDGFLSSEVFKTGHYDVVNRDQIDKVMSEFKLQRTGICDSTKCYAEIGGAVGAEKLLVGSVSKLGGTFLVNIKLIDITLIKEEFVDSVRCACEEDALLDKVSELVRKMAAQTAGYSPGVGKPASPGAVPAPPEAGRGDLRVETTPPGADLYVDAERRGVTPVDVKGLEEGPHRLTVVSKGYASLEEGVTIVTGQRVDVKRTLVEQTGALNVESTPSGVQVWVDGRYSGPSPQRLTGLRIGPHMVKVERADYETYEATPEIAYQQETRVAATLRPKPGRLLVLSNPEGADVSLDGKVVGKTPWNGTAAAGAHEIVVSLKEYASQKKSVTLAPNGAETAEMVLKKGPSAPTGADGAPMVLVPTGEFLMGSADSDSLAATDERPQHRVTLKSFSIDRYEVTNAQYGRFVKETGRVTPINTVGPQWNVWQDGWYPEGVAKHPVVNVSWDDAAAYCARAGNRLPTEAEWEKAARGTDGRIYPWGNRWDGSLANSSENSTAEVGSSPGGASPYGVEDMAGNVWEWVSDWYDDKYYNRSPALDPTGPSSGQYRVRRGGSWGNEPWLLRSAYRFRNAPTNRHLNIGFRCAQDQFP